MNLENVLNHINKSIDYQDKSLRLSAKTEMKKARDALKEFMGTTEINASIYGSESLEIIPRSHSNGTDNPKFDPKFL